MAGARGGRLAGSGKEITWSSLLPYEFDTGDVWRMILKGAFGLTVSDQGKLSGFADGRSIWAGRPLSFKELIPRFFGRLQLLCCR
jgi:hypothetical protein